MAALPVVKLLYLGIRQVSKPIASILKRTAVESTLLRSYFVLPIGQVTHKISVILKRMTLNSSRTDVKPLDEKDAVELGADIIGEIFVYSIAAVLLTREYIENNSKAIAKEEKLNKRLLSLEENIQRLGEEIRQLKSSTQNDLQSFKNEILQVQKGSAKIQPPSPSAQTAQPPSPTPALAQ